jgi:LysR family transcriptional regulator, glycine cleavage system transcriptional activator
MRNKRFDLPPLDRLEVFEAAARNLSFTRAAAELHLTQSAVSRSIALLEDRLGFALFERRHRALLLTEAGQALYAAAVEALEQLQDAVGRLRAKRAAPTLTVTTTLSFAAIWLIPRLAGFTRTHPGVDVRIAASNEIQDLERSGIDVAVRYTTAERALGATRLFGEEVFPVCSPALTRDPSRPLGQPADLRHHVLLHVENLHETPWLVWAQWLEAAGIPDLKPAASLHFSHYEQLVRAAIDGQGVALGRTPLMRDLLRSGKLVTPFARTIASPRCYYLVRSKRSLGNPDADVFAQWVRGEAARSAAPSDPAGGRRKARKLAS